MKAVANPLLARQALSKLLKRWALRIRTPGPEGERRGWEAAHPNPGPVGERGERGKRGRHPRGGGGQPNMF